ncbi:MAG: hypothetical protein J4N71_09860, partial [Chloroflexi bacterium]|nr:hypothetical protein [Chloroflexota bacterium]
EALIVAQFPTGEGEADPEAEEQTELVMDVVRAIRNIRAERGVDAGRFIEAYIASNGPSTEPAGSLRTGADSTLEQARPIVEALARVRPLHLVPDTTSAPKEGVASAVLSKALVVVPLAGLIDTDAERAKLSKQMTEAEGEIKRLEGKLANEKFRSRAPADVVAKEQERLAAAESRAEGLRGRLAELG